VSDDRIQIILDELREHRRESADRHESMDGRVRKIEHWQSNADGKITAFGVIAAGVGSILTYLAGYLKS
jgi:hypothetical protein